MISMPKHTITDLHQMQSLPLSAKIQMTQRRIEEWVDRFGEDGVYVSFSGGKDSTVLLDIARKLYPDLKAMFVDVPTQYVELREFVKSFDNVDIVKPKISFMEVCEKYGFPLISKEVSECVSHSKKFLMVGGVLRILLSQINRNRRICRRSREEQIYLQEIRIYA